MAGSRTKILLTSFRPWLAHHLSNSSDDLLELLQGFELPTVELIFERKLIVDTSLASQKVIAAIAQHQPDLILCCGMAESYEKLTLESQAFYKDKYFHTSLNLKKICAALSQTEISHDAGKFVCEGLYFHVLQYLDQKQLNTPAVFIHVPRLNAKNQAIILKDFQSILKELGHNLEEYYLSRKELG